MSGGLFHEGLAAGTATPSSSFHHHDVRTADHNIASIIPDDGSVTHMVSLERTPLASADMPPLMPLDLGASSPARVMASSSSALAIPSCFFLATPAELCADRGLEPCLTQRERLDQFASFVRERESSNTAVTFVSPARTTSCDRNQFIDGFDASRSMNDYQHQHDRYYGDDDHDDDYDDNNMIDEEVADAVERATRASKVPKFKLRPKPLQEHEFWDPDYLFRI